MRLRRGLLACVAVAALLTTAACTGDSSDPTPPKPTRPRRRPRTSSPSASSARATCSGVPGDGRRLEPRTRTTIDVTIESWPTQAAMRAAIEGGAAVPDVFLSSRPTSPGCSRTSTPSPSTSCSTSAASSSVTPTRATPSRRFSADDRLQCMPYGVSPDGHLLQQAAGQLRPDAQPRPRRTRRGRDRAGPSTSSRPPPSSPAGRRAAPRASTSRRRCAGLVAVHPVGRRRRLRRRRASRRRSRSPATAARARWSAPSSCCATRRSPSTSRSSPRRRPLTWFQRGKLGMIAGDRSLIADPAPGRAASTSTSCRCRCSTAPRPSATSPALCMSSDDRDTALAADFMVHEISADSVGLVASTGYLAARQRRGRALRRLPPARPPARARGVLQHQRPLDGRACPRSTPFPSSRRPSSPEPPAAGLRRRRPRPRRHHHPDRRRVQARPRPRVRLRLRQPVRVALGVAAVPVVEEAPPAPVSKPRQRRQGDERGIRACPGRSPTGQLRRVRRARVDAAAGFRRGPWLRRARQARLEAPAA